MRTASRRLATTALAVLVAVLLTGCGDSLSALNPIGPPSLRDRPPAEVLTGARERLDTETFRFDFAFDLTVTDAASGQTVSSSSSGEGVVDPVNQRGEMTMTLPGADGAAAPVRMIIDGDAMLVEASEQNAQQLGVEPGQWLRSSTADLPGASAGWSTPALNTIPADVTVVGTEDIRGDETVHYQFDVNAADVLDEASVAELAAATGETAPLIPMEMWIDGQARVRKTMTQTSIDAPEGSVQVSATAEMWEFGVAVATRPPPAEQVVDGPAAGLDPSGGLGGAGGDPGAPATGGDVVAAPAPCEVLTAEDIEQAIGSPVTAVPDEENDLCDYEGAGSTGEPLVTLFFIRTIGSVEDFQVHVQRSFDLLSVLETNLTRLPIAGTSLPVEVLASEDTLTMMTFPGLGSFEISLRVAAPAEGPDTRLETVDRLSNLVRQRLPSTGEPPPDPLTEAPAEEEAPPPAEEAAPAEPRNACDYLTVEEVEQAIGVAVETDIPGYNCSYRVSGIGTGPEVLTLTFLDSVNTIDAYQLQADKYWEIKADGQDEGDVAREPIEGLGESAEAQATPFSLEVLAFNGEMIEIEVNLRPPEEGEDPRQEPVVELARLVLDRLSGAAPLPAQDPPAEDPAAEAPPAEAPEGDAPAA